MKKIIITSAMVLTSIISIAQEINNTDRAKAAQLQQQAIIEQQQGASAPEYKAYLAEQQLQQAAKDAAVKKIQQKAKAQSIIAANKNREEAIAKDKVLAATMPKKTARPTVAKENGIPNKSNNGTATKATTATDVLTPEQIKARQAMVENAGKSGSGQR